MKAILNLSGLCALLLFCARVNAQAPADVPKDHWAYGAVEALAQQGMIKGYAPDGKFLGKRTVLRYEMAVIVHRILTRVDELLEAKENKSTAPAAPRINNAATVDQLESVRKLAEEFKFELTVIGADLKKMNDRLTQLESKAAENGQISREVGTLAKVAVAAAAEAKVGAAVLKGDVKDLKDNQKSTKDEVGQLKKYVNAHKLDGYIQNRFEAFDSGRTSLFPAAGAGGTGQSPSNGAPSVGGPWNGFNIRRARIKASGPISERTDYQLQIDAQSTGAVSLIDAYATIKRLPVPGVTAQFGQFPPQFGFELPNTSRLRESPERSFGLGINASDYPIFKTSVNATGGVITPGSVLPLFLGQNRDDGVSLTWADPNKKSGRKATLTVINGEGRAAGGVRNNNNALDLIIRTELNVGNSLTLGASGYFGSLAVRSGPPTGSPAAPVAFKNAYRSLGEVDVRWTTPWKTKLRAEWVGGLFETTPDRAQYLENNHAQTWYVVADHPVSKKLSLFTKYDEFMPIADKGKTAGGLGRMQLIRKSINAGAAYQLDDATRLRLWYTKGLTPYDPSAASGPLRCRLGLVTGEVQIVF